MQESEKRRGEQETRKALYETQEAKTTAVIMVGLFIIAVLVGVALGGWWLLRHFEARSQLAEAPYPSETAPAQPPPPEPRLQVWPTLDMDQMRAQEDQVLQNYGWVDKGRGTVRVPIEKAMARVVERGLPVTPQKGEELLREQRELQPVQWSSGRVWERIQP